MEDNSVTNAVQSPAEEQAPVPGGGASEYAAALGQLASITASVLSSLMGSACSAGGITEIPLADLRLPPGTCIFNTGGAISEREALVMPEELKAQLMRAMVGTEASAGLKPDDPAILGALREVAAQLGAAWVQHFSEAGFGEVTLETTEVTAAATAVDELGGEYPVAAQFEVSSEGVSYPVTAVVSAVSLGARSPSRPGMPPAAEPAAITPEAEPEPGAARERVAYEPVEFPELAGAEPVDRGNLNLLLDVPLTITVELGRARTNIKTILGYGQGSLLTLDKLAGEQVDLLVNGKPFARGEVVVVDENFGVRITSILTPEERVQQLVKD